MIDLIIETSLRDVAIALFSEEKELFQKNIKNGRGEVLSELIDEALDATGSDVADIKRVLVTMGPGSFTGLRVGLAFAQGLCFSGKRELFGLSTLAALDAGNPLERASMVITRAKPGMYYIGSRSAGVEHGGIMENEVLVDEAGVLERLSEGSVVLIDTENEKELVEKFSGVEVKDLWSTFDLKYYASIFDKLEPMPVEKAVPNYIQEPYAK